MVDDLVRSPFFIVIAPIRCMVLLGMNARLVDHNDPKIRMKTFIVLDIVEVTKA